MIASLPKNSMEYEFGVMRLFGESDICEFGLAEDWAQPEEFHIWNNGANPTLVLSVPQPDSPCLIEVEGTGFVREGTGGQEITLYANGYWISSWRLKIADVVVLRAKIYPEQFAERGRKSLLRLTWHIPTSVTPADIGLGDDGRKLGFCFRSIRLTPITE